MIDSASVRLNPANFGRRKAKSCKPLRSSDIDSLTILFLVFKSAECYTRSKCTLQLMFLSVLIKDNPSPTCCFPAFCLIRLRVDRDISMLWLDQAVRDLSAALTEKLCSWASGKDSADVALAEWSRWVDWSLPLEIRDEGRAVSPVGVAQDGRLRVVDSETGKEELLATEYLL